MNFNNKRILGTGRSRPTAGRIRVPATRSSYFPLLDEKGRMVQSMRSGTIVRRAKYRLRRLPRGPSPAARIDYSTRGMPRFEKLKPWHGQPRLFRTRRGPAGPRQAVHYVHDYGKEAGQKLNLAGDRGLLFNTSYVDLRRKGYVRVVGAGPSQVQMPLSWGSPVSPLAKIVLEGHGIPEVDRQVKLDQEAVDRLLTWIDINAPYYPTTPRAPTATPRSDAPL